MRLKTLILAAALVVAGAALAGASGPIHANFENGIPPGWKPAGMGPQNDRGQVNTLQEPGGNHFLRIATNGTFYSIGITSPFNPAEYPVVSWRWRVTKLPAGADISRKASADAAARLFVTFARNSARHEKHPRALVYVWDSKYPVGTILPSPYLPRTEKLIVLESGSARAGQWISERVDLVSDYRRAYGGDAPEVEKIACATGSAHTHSASVADFDDLEVTTRANPVRK